MKKILTKADARRFKARWAMVNTAEVRETATASIEWKFRQLAALMASAKAFGIDPAFAEEELEVRRRWLRLKQARA